MSVPQITLQTARHLHLAAQGLLRKPSRRATPGDVLKTIQRMSLLQIDTINIVARSPYLVLFSRLGKYPVQWLDDALKNGDLIIDLKYGHFITSITLHLSRVFSLLQIPYWLFRLISVRILLLQFLFFIYR